MAYLKRHRETLFVILLGLMIFGALNWMMVNVDPELFTNTRLGPFSAFKKLVVSGFDFYTYSVVTLWQPRYVLFRHPMLSLFVWPLSEINHFLKEEYGINCAIYIVGAVWTMISTLCWTLSYKIIRKVIGLSWLPSLLYTLLFFSFAYVMLATFIADHMILTLCVLLITIYVVTSAKGKIPVWKMLLLYFIGTGISTTNCVKIWLMDMCGKYSSSLPWKENALHMFKRSLYFFIPSILLLGCYFWQDNNTQEDFRKGQKRMAVIKLKTDSVYAKQREKTKVQDLKRKQDQIDKQLMSSEFFMSTDLSVDRFTMLYENIFGEGLLLHKTHVLEDAGSPSKPRPIFVRYTCWAYYLINGIIVILAICGLWIERRKRIVWAVLLPFLFDMFLHIGLCFATIDVYIMTAHWAFILPVGIALLDKKLSAKRMSRASSPWILRGLMFLVAIFLWVHNLSIIANHLSSL